MNNSGTLPAIFQGIVDFLDPIKKDLEEGRLKSLFINLGIAIPDNFENSPQLATNISATVSAIDELIPLVGQLIDEIQNENNDEIIKISKDIFGKGKIAFDNIKNIADAVQNLGGTINNIPAGQRTAYFNSFPKRFFDFLIISNIERVPSLAESLELVELISRTEEPALGTPPAEDILYINRTLHLEQLPKVISRPHEIFENVYGWGHNAFESEKLLKRLANIFTSLNIPSIYDDSVSPPVLDVLILEISEEISQPIPGLQFQLRESLPVAQDLSFSEDHFEINMELAGDIAPNAVFSIHPGGGITQQLSGGINGRTALELLIRNQSGPIILIGESLGSRLQIQSFSTKKEIFFSFDSATNTSSGELRITGEIKNGKLIIDNSKSDGFLSKILPENIETEFNLVLGWSTETGLIFQGSSALEIDIPAHIGIGPIDISEIHLAVGLSNEGFNTSLGLSAKADLGPFKASVQNIGLKADITVPGDGGNLGPVNVDLGFKFPDGIGIQVDASVIKGGGFLYIDVEKGEYAGVVELTIQNTISLKAIGIINTKLPNGEDGFALLLLITAEFTPIQLGFGFTLNAVGGLIGANRGMNLTAIREGVRNDTLDHILFPDDPVANAPAIISNLNSVFPISEGNHSFGIMGIIGWGTPTLLEVELGLMITFPSFDLAVIGKVSTALPTKEAAILKLNVAFAGTMSFEKKYFYFDAAIFDSKLLTFSLSGQMSLRILWGDEPNFVLSVGGFHPDFVPPPLELNDLERITLNLLADDNPKLTLKCYFAVTSNTVQFGASIDFLFKVSKFKVVGYFYFHALFQFDPFYFKVSIGAGLDVKLGSSTILSVSVSGSLEGPTPWKIKGKGKFKILFISFSVSFSETWGETRDTSLPGIEVYPKLKEAILDNRSWVALLPQNSTLTSLRDIKKEDEESLEEFTIHPFGSLSLLQRVVPLKETIDLFGNQEPSDFNRFELSMELDNGKIVTSDKKDFFAPAQFFDLSDADKISKDAYVKYKAGLAASTTENLSAKHHVNRVVEYEIEVLDSKDNPPKKGVYIQSSSQMAHWSKGTAIAKSELGLIAEQKILERGKTISFKDESFVIVNQSNLTPIADVAAGSEIELQNMLNEIVLENPDMESELMVVSSFEIL